MKVRVVADHCSRNGARCAEGQKLRRKVQTLVHNNAPMHSIRLAMDRASGHVRRCVDRGLGSAGTSQEGGSQ